MQDPDTPAEAWIEITNTCGALDEDIIGTIGEVETLHKDIETSEEKLANLKGKYKTKKGVHGDCKDEKADRKQDIDELRKDQEKSNKKLKKAIAKLEKLGISESSGEEAMKKKKELDRDLANLQ